MTRAEMIERAARALAGYMVDGRPGDWRSFVGEVVSVLDSLGLTADSPTAWLAPWEATEKINEQLELIADIARYGVDVPLSTAWEGAWDDIREGAWRKPKLK